MAIIYKFSEQVYRDFNFIQQEVLKNLKSSEDYKFAVEEILKNKQEIKGFIWKRRASLVLGILGIASSTSSTAKIGIGLLLVAYIRYCTKKKSHIEEEYTLNFSLYCAVKDSIEADLEKAEPLRWSNYIKVFAYNHRHLSMPAAFNREAYFENKLPSCFLSP